MTKDQVIKLRDEINANSNGIIITMDNMMVFSDKAEFVIWDDDNEYIHCIRANTGYHTQAQSPVEVVSSTYEHIQYITGYINSKNAISLVEDFASNNLMDEETKTKAINFINSLQNHLI